MTLNHRENALLGYFAIIAFSPRVRAAKTIEPWLKAVGECLIEDLPAVAATVLENVVVAKVEPVVRRFIGGLFQELANAGKRR